MSVIIRLIYSALLSLAAPLLLYGLYRNKPNKPKFGHRWKEHFGITPQLKRNHKRPIWIHTVSVGETIAATPFIRALKQQYPDIPIVITTTTSTGAEQAGKLSDIAEHRYMPIDFSFAIKRFIKAINPQIILIMETELWPNTVHHVSKADIPIVVINARLSERSAKRYAKVQLCFNLLSRGLTRILCQHQDDADRFKELGVIPSKLAVTGSLKFDISITPETIKAGDQLRMVLGQARPVWIAASTHKGEDEQVLAAHQKLLQSHPNALLILVPRHPERFDAVYQLCGGFGFSTLRRTQSFNSDEAYQVYLGDTMGEMLVLMQSADVCFIGGSLLGDKVGGHNPLEPAALGKPILTGPSYFNFQDITNSLIATHSLTVIDDTDALTSSVDELFSDSERRTRQGLQVMAFVKNNKGSITKTLEYINVIG